MKANHKNHNQMCDDGHCHTKNDYGNDHAHQKKSFSKWKIFFYIFLIMITIFFVAIDILKSENLKYARHYGIWIPITSYVVFWEGKNYFKVYKNPLKMFFNSNLLIALSSHILYIFSLVNSLINYDNPTSYNYDVFWEAPIILIIFTNVGHMLQGFLTKKSNKEFDNLVNLNKSMVKIFNNKNEVIEVHIKDVKVNDVLFLQKGDIVLLDGTLISTVADFDFSNITGESKVVHLSKNNKVISGAFVLNENVQVKVTKVFENSTINKIINKMEEASKTKPKMQQLVDKLLKWITPFVLLVALLSLIFWLVAGYVFEYKLPWNNEDASYDLIALKSMITTLAIVCPCSLAMAAPAITIITVLLSSENGLILNQPKVMEYLKNVKYIIFDKTGTITTNELEVVNYYGDKKYLAIAKYLEKGINHPIAKSIYNFVKTETKLTNVKELFNHKGFSGTFKNKKYYISSYDDVKKDFNKNCTLIALYENNKVVLIYELVNKIKSNVKKTIKRLQKKYELVMLTGDSLDVANYVANEVGIKKVYASQTPNDKFKVIKELQTQGETFFIGDGFNDGIAIKQSTVSAAFSSGSTLSNDVADISITNSNFNSIEKLVLLSKNNNKFTKLSLLWAVLFNLCAIPIAFLLLVQPWMGALIMSLSDFFIVFGSLFYKWTLNKKLEKI